MQEREACPSRATDQAAIEAMEVTHPLRERGNRLEAAARGAVRPPSGAEASPPASLPEVPEAPIHGREIVTQVVGQKEVQRDQAEIRPELA